MSFLSLFPKERKETRSERAARGAAEALALAEAMAAESLAFESEPESVKNGLRFVRRHLAVCLPAALILAAWLPVFAAAASLAFGVSSYFYLKLKKNKPNPQSAAPLVAAAVGAVLGAAIVHPIIQEVLHGAR
jgi:hypothetical protein